MPPPPTLLSLPNELLFAITNHITGPHRTRTLAALSLTCHRFNRIADGALYSHMQMQIGKEDLLTRTLRERQDLRDRVLDVGRGCRVMIWFGEGIEEKDVSRGTERGTKRRREMEVGDAGRGTDRSMRRGAPRGSG